MSNKGINVGSTAHKALKALAKRQQVTMERAATVLIQQAVRQLDLSSLTISTQGRKGQGQLVWVGKGPHRSVKRIAREQGVTVERAATQVISAALQNLDVKNLDFRLPRQRFQQSDRYRDYMREYMRSYNQKAKQAQTEEGEANEVTVNQEQTETAAA